MNLKKIYYLVLCALVACTTASCKDSNDDYIPPALEPEKPEVLLNLKTRVRMSPFM